LIFACAKQKSRGGRGAVLWQWENGACHVSVCVGLCWGHSCLCSYFYFHFVIKYALIELIEKLKLFLLRDKVCTDSHREMTAAHCGSCQLAVCRRRNFRAPAGGEKKSTRAREWFSTRKVRRTQFATTNFMHELHIYWKCFFLSCYVWGRNFIVVWSYDSFFDLEIMFIDRRWRSMHHLCSYSSWLLNHE